MKMPILGKRFEAILSPSGEKITGRIRSRAGKLGKNKEGKYKYWFNVDIDGEESTTSIDFEKLARWRITPEIEDSLVAWEGLEIDKAKSTEISNWRKREVFEEVEDKGQKTISTRWIITEKIGRTGKNIKARLVARGFEEESDLETDSPTCSKEALRTSIMIMKNNNWMCKSIDIRTAYLQGKEIQRSVYLQPPEEYYNGNIWKLKMHTHLIRT